MNRLRVGDKVKVMCPSSQWRDSSGVVTEIIQRLDAQNVKCVQECAVRLKGGGRCWFMAEHLVRLRSPKLDRLLRSEITNRWPIDPTRTESLDISRAGLIRFLCEYFGFSQSRATIEADELFSEFDKRLQCARDSEGAIEQLKVS
jgi:hypothetical protein